jgi:hypothetical protein
MRFLEVKWALPLLAGQEFGHQFSVSVFLNLDAGFMQCGQVVAHKAQEISL